MKVYIIPDGESTDITEREVWDRLRVSIGNDIIERAKRLEFLADNENSKQKRTALIQAANTLRELVAYELGDSTAIATQSQLNTLEMR